MTKEEKTTIDEVKWAELAAELEEGCSVSAGSGLVLNQPKFKPGDVVIFDPSTYRSDYWDNLPEEDRLKYYGIYGYRTGKNPSELFCYLTHINDPDRECNTGHCVLVNLRNGKVLCMCHEYNFRLATEDEF